MTPGNQPMMVRMMLTTKVPPNPCFIKTAAGGNMMFKIIVKSDMFFVLKVNNSKFWFFTFKILIINT